jgi:hypothetical protein
MSPPFPFLSCPAAPPASFLNWTGQPRKPHRHNVILVTLGFARLAEGVQMAGGAAGERVEMVAILYVLPIKKKQRTVSLSAGGVVEREERRGVGFLKGLEKEGRKDDAGECDGKATECILLHQGPQSSMLSRDRESIHKRRASQAGVRRKALVKSHGMSNNQKRGVSSKLPSSA